MNADTIEGDHDGGREGARPARDMDLLARALEEGGELDSETLARIEDGHGSPTGGMGRVLARYRELLHELRGARGGPRLSAGSRVGDFEVESLHARGGMGEVYRARQLSLGGRRVALKVLPVNRSTALDVARFEREALVLSELHHPHLAEVYGFGRQGDLRFLAMRFVEGPSLAELLEQDGGAVEREDAVRWVEQVAEALSVVHAAGVVHRDVKPSNVMLHPSTHPGGSGQNGDTPRRDAVLVDFGLARKVDSWTHTTGGVAPVTAAYAAPEQLLGTDVDARADVFSLGAVLHDLLSGGDPRTREPAAAGLERLPERPDLDRDLRAVVACATSHERSARYRDAGVFLADLRAWSNGDPVAARPREWRSRLLHVVVKKRTLLLRWGLRGTLLTLVAFLLVATLFFVRRATEVRAAHGSGDLPRVAALVAGLPGGLDRLLFADEGLAELAGRLRSADLRDPLVATADRLEANDVDGAAQVLAAFVRRDGLTADPVLVDVMGSLLDHWGDREPRGHVLQRLAAASALPIALPERTPEIERLAARVRAVYANPGADEGVRLSSLSLLSVLGTSEDARVITACLEACDLWSEELRLGCEVLGRLLRRSTGAPHLGQVLEAVERGDLLRRIREARAAGDSRTWGHAAAFQRLGEEVQLARRRLGLPPAPSLTLPEEWLASDDVCWGKAWHYTTAHELAAAGDGRARGVLDDLQPSEPSRVWQAYLVGSVAGLLDDPAFLEDAARKLEELGWEPAGARADCRRAWDLKRASVERGVSIADEPLDGGPPSALPGDVAARPLLTRRGSAQGRAYVGCSEDAVVTLGGEAVALTAHGVELYRDGSDPHCLLFRHIGLSRLELELEHDPVEARRLSLNVYGQNSARRYLPHQGTVRLELFLDGRFVGAQSGISSGREHFRFGIPASWLTGGTHELELRLAPESTTSFRMFQLSLKSW